MACSKFREVHTDPASGQSQQWLVLQKTLMCSFYGLLTSPWCWLKFHCVSCLYFQHLPLLSIASFVRSQSASLKLAIINHNPNTEFCFFRNGNLLSSARTLKKTCLNSHSSWAVRRGDTWLSMRVLVYLAPFEMFQRHNLKGVLCASGMMALNVHKWTRLQLAVISATLGEVTIAWAT